MTMWTPLLDQPDAPRYLAIADAIERDVASGVLADGARLPTHRALADRLGVTVGTVTRGYAEAGRRGLTTGEVGRGTFVRQVRAEEEFGWRDAGRVVGSDAIDMSLSCPWVPPDGSDGRELARTLGEISRARPLDELLTYDPTTALPRHRAAAASWIGKLGLEVSPDRIVVTSGAQHAMLTILASFLSAGDVLATASLTYPGLRAVARMLGLRIRGIELDGEGIVPESLDAACESVPVKALYCVPTLQNPTCVTMGEGRRRAIAEVARRRGLLVIEDEIHVPFGAVMPPIASFAPERTFHITTLSKWVTFGLRVGFVATPERAVERLSSGVRSSLWQSPPLMIEVATRWIADGTAERMGQQKLVELEARHEIVREVLGGRFEVQTHSPHALHVWVHLPESQRSDECVAQARQRGVLLAGAEAFAVGREIPAAVRASIAQVPHRQDVRRGLEILGAILEDGSDPYARIL